MKDSLLDVCRVHETTEGAMRHRNPDQSSLDSGCSNRFGGEVLQPSVFAGGFVTLVLGRLFRHVRQSMGCLIVDIIFIMIVRHIRCRLHSDAAYC